MQKKYRLISTTLLLMLALGLMLSAPLTSAQDSEEDPITQVDTYFMQLTEDDKFSGSVLIARDGEILLNKGYGFAVREWQVPNTPDTKFRIASITKQFTAMAILKLQEDGLLSVDDPICQYLEDCPDTWQEITIHQLLTHTSGIGTFAGTDEEFGKKQVWKIVTDAMEEPLIFQPGTLWGYSNTGYIVLGSIIDEVSGVSYEQYLKDAFLDMLGMADTGYDFVSQGVIERHAEGYQNATKRADYIYIRSAYAGGGLYSTTEDLLKWVAALHNGEVVSPESWNRMMERAVETGSSSSYAYGTSIENHFDQTLIGHTGRMPGFAGYTGYILEQETTIIILVNIEIDISEALDTIVERLSEE